MKQFFFFATLSILAVSCGNHNKPVHNGLENNNPASQAQVAQSFDLDSLLTVADQKVNDTIKVRGYVTHTCKHSGKRCFIVGKSQSASLRVEAKGEIGGFNRELTGALLEITGVVKERKLTKEYIDQTEKELNERKQKEDGSAETCQAELNNISQMREKMKELGKDYYSIYYMDGLNYDVVQE
ncbi:MAG: hypothetical protein QM786_12170 [Breznakibacter sp.]